MARKAGRSTEDTRRLLLDAAAAMVRTHGAAATLDQIARHAGISKGGLVYHFASKDDLLLALATDLLQRWRRAVEAARDPEDQDPGRLTRAYVRACLDPTVDEQRVRDDIGLTAQLMTSPDVSALVRADSERWRSELHGDGLPGELLTLVVAAADGASVAPLWGAAEQSEVHARLQDQLIALTYHRDARAGSAGDRATQPPEAGL